MAIMNLATLGAAASLVLCAAANPINPIIALRAAEGTYTGLATFNDYAAQSK